MLKRTLVVQSENGIEKVDLLVEGEVRTDSSWIVDDTRFQSIAAERRSYNDTSPTPKVDSQACIEQLITSSATLRQREIVTVLQQILEYANQSYLEVIKKKMHREGDNVLTYIIYNIPSLIIPLVLHGDPRPIQLVDSEHKFRLVGVRDGGERVVHLALQCVEPASEPADRGGGGEGRGVPDPGAELAVRGPLLLHLECMDALL